MFIAMNRFRVTLGNEDEFEAVWSARESYLNELPGFLEFSLLRGPLRDDHRLYASHTVWTSRDAFARWTQSDQFRKAHARAGQGQPLTQGHPDFEGFEAILVDDNRAARRSAE
jgi:heme-degrading monooxygenase HmoA